MVDGQTPSNKKEVFFERLWNEVSSKGDFPLLQVSLDKLTATLEKDTSVADLSLCVLSDFSLSQKVIRLANSAMYASFGGDISTVSRAVIILGVETISHLAMGLQLLDNFNGAARNYPHANDELKRAMLAGEVARALGGFQGINQAEEAVVCSLMRQVSRMLLVFYFPEQWAMLSALSKSKNITESEACTEVLGVSLEEIGEAAANKWKLPGNIAATLTLKVAPQRRPKTHIEWLNAMAETASKSAKMLLDGDTAKLKDYLERQSYFLGIQTTAVQNAIKQVLAFKEELDLKQPSQLGGGSGPIGKPEDCYDRLYQKHKEMVRTAPGKPVGALIPLLAESIKHSFNFNNCFVMLLDSKARRYVAKLGIGPLVTERLDELSFEEGFVPDFFHFAITSRRPIFLEDIKSPETASRVPHWFRRRFKDTRSVLITQVHANNRCIALVCGEWGPTLCEEGVSSSELQMSAALTGELEAAFNRIAASNMASSAQKVTSKLTLIG